MSSPAAPRTRPPRPPRPEPDADADADPDADADAEPDADADAEPDADTQAPSIPQGMAWTTKTQTGIGVRWNASTDNVGVTGYRLYRNGTLVGTTTSPAIHRAPARAAPATRSA